MPANFAVQESFLPAGARAARERLVLRLLLRFPRLFVCLFVCLCICVSALITCAIYYVTRYLRAKLQQMKVVLCCLDGENVVGSRKDPVLVAYSY